MNQSGCLPDTLGIIARPQTGFLIVLRNMTALPLIFLAEIGWRYTGYSFVH